MGQERMSMRIRDNWSPDRRGVMEKNIFKALRSLSMFKYQTGNLVEKKRLKIIEGEGIIFSPKSPRKQVMIQSASTGTSFVTGHR